MKICKYGNKSRLISFWAKQRINNSLVHYEAFQILLLNIMKYLFLALCCNCGFRQQLRLKTNRQILLISLSQAITCCTVWINTICKTLGHCLRALRAAVLILRWGRFVCETSTLWISSHLCKNLQKRAFPSLIYIFSVTVAVAFLHRVPQLTLGFIVPGCLVVAGFFHATQDGSSFGVITVTASRGRQKFHNPSSNQTLDNKKKQNKAKK